MLAPNSKGEKPVFTSIDPGLAQDPTEPHVHEFRICIIHEYILLCMLCNPLACICVPIVP